MPVVPGDACVRTCSRGSEGTAGLDVLLGFGLRDPFPHPYSPSHLPRSAFQISHTLCVVPSFRPTRCLSLSLSLSRSLSPSVDFPISPSLTVPSRRIHPLMHRNQKSPVLSRICASYIHNPPPARSLGRDSGRASRASLWHTDTVHINVRNP